MSKFKIKLKLQGLDLEVEGSREDLPQLSAQLGAQLTGLIQPALALVEGGSTNDVSPRAADVVTEGETPKRKKKRAARTVGAANTDTSDTTIDWTHDPRKWGSPTQNWNTLQKSIWLIYVASKEKGLSELTQSQITATFNKHFKQAGTIMGSNVARDLGKKKLGRDALVGENTTKSPSAWFLTETGEAQAQKLISGQPSEAE
jgi:hypothetical protein